MPQGIRQADRPPAARGRVAPACVPFLLVACLLALLTVALPASAGRLGPVEASRAAASTSQRTSVGDEGEAPLGAAHADIVAKARRTSPLWPATREDDQHATCDTCPTAALSPSAPALAVARRSPPPPEVTTPATTEPSLTLPHGQAPPRD